MDRNFRQGIYETLADVFETVFLIPLEHMEGIDPPCGVGAGSKLLKLIPPRVAPSREFGGWPREYLEVRVDLLRECNSPAFFFFPAELVKRIAGGFLGLDVGAMDVEELAPVARMAAIMIIGGVLARVDPDALIRAGEPQSRSISNFVPGPSEMPGAWVYKTGQGYLWVDVGRIELISH